ncbi:hypothetical protein MMC29_006928 [Sticta canariensis]|nr:hypothetical protein [Sticta canariensis]
MLGSCQFQSPLLNFLAPSIHHKPSFTPRSGSHLVFTLPAPQRPYNFHQTFRQNFSCSTSNPAEFQDAKSSNNPPVSLRFTPVAPAQSSSENLISDLLEDTLSSGSRSRNRRRGSLSRPSSLSLVQEAYAKQGEIASGMVMPPDYGLPETTVSASYKMANVINNLQSQPRASRSIHSHPSLGRAIEIQSRTDLARSFFQLNKLVRQNKVKHYQKMQRFHERPGVRRKRLQRERWRARFKDNFHNAVEKIKTMKRMGW